MINLEGIDIDRCKKKQLEEFVEYKLSHKQSVSFGDIQRNVGISSQQWEILRMNNSENKMLHWRT